MSEDTTAVATEEVNTPPTTPVVFETSEFVDGDWKGFKFVSPTFNGVDGINAAVEMYGADVVASLISNQTQARIRTKVKNGLPKGLKPDEMRKERDSRIQAHPDGVLFSQSQAAEWRPDVRELSPNQLFKKAKEAFAEGKIDEGQALLAKMAEVMKG
jgi:hypothetical protein